MSLLSKIVCLALLFIPGAFSSETVENHEVVRRTTEVNTKQYGCSRELEAIISNPSATYHDCESDVCGLVRFACPETWSSHGLTEVHYFISGLTPGLHALHVHQFRVGTEGEETCTSTGGHWNPEEVNHGGNLNAQRHIGDLGNILADENGLAEGTLLAYAPLRGPLGIQGKAVVVHEGTDDLGTGGDDGSRAVGNAGARPGCGNIIVV